MYEARIVKFLRENPDVKVSPFDLARLWRRSARDVLVAAHKLHTAKTIKYSYGGVISLV